MNPFKKKTHSPEAVILDTCALIDGRIVDIARAGFVPRRIIVPQFVVAELQFLADKGDSYKRERARYGLDVARNLQDLPRNIISIAREQYGDIKEVDDKLIALAKERGAMLYTTDYNLNKVAQIEGVQVLNVNELAQALRPNRLPGERLELKITQVGQDKTQGVGYLDDGTMVVVEKASNRVGQRVVVEFSRMLQTQAGKMMFATLPKDKEQPSQPEANHRHANAKRVTSTSPAQTNKPTAAAGPTKGNNEPSKSPQKQTNHQAISDTNKPRQHKHKPQYTSRSGDSAGATQHNRRPRQTSSKRRTPEDALLEALERQDR